MSQAAQWSVQQPVGDRLQGLADASPSGVILVKSKRVAWASERFAETAGRGSSAALIGASLGDLFKDTGSGLPNANTRRSIECQLQRPDGDNRTVICRLVRADAESADTAAWVLEDVTHIHVVERELLRASQGLHTAHRDITNLRERLRKEIDEREELLTVVSHELRTPVTIISGYNRLLLAEKIGALNDEQRRFLSESSNACYRLNEFIGNLLEAFRVSPEGVVLEIAHASVLPVVDEVVGLLRPLLEAGELEVQVRIDPSAERARFDRIRLGQILTNLLGNAIKFSPLGGTIEVATRAVPRLHEGAPERSCIEIRISDEGPGVALEDRKRIFDAYVQVGEESRAGGLGLGLAICKRLVEAHGGSISVGDGSDGGSSFAFTLPVSESPRKSEIPRELREEGS
jgi:signal transduction histidine kinase